MEEDLKDPLQLVKELVLLIVEARTPDLSIKGRVEGPHCPVIRGRPAHKCNAEKFECLRASEFCYLATRLWQNNIPICLDILLFPDCPHGRQEALVIDGAVTRSSTESSLLVEKWIIDGSKRRQDEGLSSNMLLQAVRSYLHFSQISSWLYSIGGKLPGTLAYRVYAPGEDASLEFPQPPDLHKFPICHAHHNAITVSVTSLRRQQNVPQIVCGIEDPAPSPTQAWGPEDMGDPHSKGGWTHNGTQASSVTPKGGKVKMKSVASGDSTALPSKKSPESFKNLDKKNISKTCSGDVSKGSLLLQARTNVTGSFMSLGQQPRKDKPRSQQAASGASVAGKFSSLGAGDGGDCWHLTSMREFVRKSFGQSVEAAPESPRWADASGQEVVCGHECVGSDRSVQCGGSPQARQQFGDKVDLNKKFAASLKNEEVGFNLDGNRRKGARVKKKDGDKDLRIEQRKQSRSYDDGHVTKESAVCLACEAGQKSPDDSQAFIHKKKKELYKLRDNSERAMFLPYSSGKDKSSWRSRQSAGNISSVYNCHEDNGFLHTKKGRPGHFRSKTEPQTCYNFLKKTPSDGSDKQKKLTISQREANEEEFIRKLSDRLSLVNLSPEDPWHPRTAKQQHVQELLDCSAVLRSSKDRNQWSVPKKIPQTKPGAGRLSSSSALDMNPGYKTPPAGSSVLSELSICVTSDLAEDSDTTPVPSPNETPRSKSVSESLVKSVAEKTVRQNWHDYQQSLADNQPSLYLSDQASRSHANHDANQTTQTTYRQETSCQPSSSPTFHGQAFHPSQHIPSTSYHNTFQDKHPTDFFDHQDYNKHSLFKSSFTQTSNHTDPEDFEPYLSNPSFDPTPHSTTSGVKQTSRKIFEENLLPLVSYDADSDSFQKVEQNSNKNILHSPKVLFSCDVPSRSSVPSGKCIDFTETLESDFFKSRICDVVSPEAIGSYLSNLSALTVDVDVVDDVTDTEIVKNGAQASDGFDNDQVIKASNRTHTNGEIKNYDHDSNHDINKETKNYDHDSNHDDRFSKVYKEHRKHGTGEHDVKARRQLSYCPFFDESSPPFFDQYQKFKSPDGSDQTVNGTDIHQSETATPSPTISSLSSSSSSSSSSSNSSFHAAPHLNCSMQNENSKKYQTLNETEMNNRHIAKSKSPQTKHLHLQISSLETSGLDRTRESLHTTVQDTLATPSEALTIPPPPSTSSIANNKTCHNPTSLSLAGQVQPLTQDKIKPQEISYSDLDTATLCVSNIEAPAPHDTYISTDESAETVPESSQLPAIKPDVSDTVLSEPGTSPYHELLSQAGTSSKAASNCAVLTHVVSLTQHVSLTASQPDTSPPSLTGRLSDPPSLAGCLPDPQFQSSLSNICDNQDRSSPGTKTLPSTDSNSDSTPETGVYTDDVAAALHTSYVTTTLTTASLSGVPETQVRSKVTISDKGHPLPKRPSSLTNGYNLNDCSDASPSGLNSSLDGADITNEKTLTFTLRDGLDQCPSEIAPVIKITESQTKSPDLTSFAPTTNPDLTSFTHNAITEQTDLKTEPILVPSEQKTGPLLLIPDQLTTTDPKGQLNACDGSTKGQLNACDGSSKSQLNACDGSTLQHGRSLQNESLISMVSDDETFNDNEDDLADHDVVFYLSESKENNAQVHPALSQSSMLLSVLSSHPQSLNPPRSTSLSLEYDLEIRSRTTLGTFRAKGKNVAEPLSGSPPLHGDPPGWSSVPPHRTVSTPSCMDRESQVQRSPSKTSVITTPNCDMASQLGLRKLAARSASMIFNSRTGLPTQSSPAPLKRKPGGSFDYDSSLINTRALKSAFSCSKLLMNSSEKKDENEEDKKRTLSTSAPASTNCLLGNFEESILNGRIDPVGTVEGFTAEIGASGTFCPKHLHLPVSAFFFALSEDNAPSPYLGHINLEAVSKKGYHIPKKGTLQVTLFNPNKTVVKMFVVMYDLSDMPASSQTFIRQRTVYSPTDENSSAPSFLRYLIHLRCASSRSGKVYLHTDIRLIFARHKLDIDAKSVPYELKSYTEGPRNPKYSPKK
ncbi:uncharacterized protein LOC131957268 [Physella acuta]|uniref:uncharacterized protein LOC131957268 n=1 Tax=Physella acuta TaxID=109671 RepID=UPI0027DE8188|nr:uncharacterized protein LOC131957268 [Physella acuta]